MAHWKRKKARIIIGLLCAAAFLLIEQVQASQEATATILVRIKPNIQLSDGSLQDAVQRWSLRAQMQQFRVLGSHTPLETRPSDLRSVYELTVERSGLRDALAALQSDPAVVYAEENVPVHALFTPNDPSYTSQWHLPKVGADNAWERADTPPFGGSSTVVVAVIDTGVAYENSTNRGKTFAQAPDFVSTTFVAGYDFVNDSAHANDDNGHGTHVAATIAENTNNGIDGAGIAFATSIMPIKTLDAEGSGAVADVVEGITFAVQNGAKVINLSLGASYASQSLQDAVAAAVNAGVVVVAAAGNDGASSLSLPAGYPGVISVAALGKSDTISSFSNYGTGLSLSAPGGDGSDYIMQQTFSNLDAQNLPVDYTTFGMVGYQGTSQAAPQVAAAAALLLAKGVSASSIASLLENTATDLGTAGYDTQYGYGMLNVGSALIAYLNDTTPPVTAITVSPGTPDGANGYYKTTPLVTLTATDGAASSGVQSITYQIDGGSATTYSAPFTIADGTHSLTYFATDIAGNVETSQTAQFTVDATGPVVTVISPSAGTTTQETITLVGTISDALSGAASLTVNGVAAVIDASGGFTVPVALRRGSNLIPLSAVDVAGAISSTTFHIVLVKPASVVISSLDNGPPRTKMFSQSGKRTGQFVAFAQGRERGVVLAAGDLNADGYDEVVAARRSGTQPQIRVFSNKGKLLKTFFAYDKKFRGGVSVATADIDGSGQAVIVTAPGPGQSPDIKLYSMQGALLSHFLAYDKKYRNGVRVTAGDVDGDGKSEIITGPVQGKRTKVKIFRSDGTLVKEFYVYGSKFGGGVWLASGDLDGDGTDEIIAGPGAGGSPVVKIVDADGKVQRSITAFEKDFLGGVTVSAGDMNKDGHDDIVVGSGAGRSPMVKIVSSAGKVLKKFSVFTTSYHGGIFVAAGVLK